MNNTLRWSLLYSTATAALLALGSQAAMAQTFANITGGGSTLAGPDYVNEFTDDVNISGAGFDFQSYCLVGSGAGTSAFISNTAVPLHADAVNCASTVGPIAYGMSDAVIGSADITHFQTTYNQPVIQLPTFGTPITFPFNLAGKTTDGAITLTDAQLCGIFSGAIIDWHTIDSSIASGTMIKVVYRTDGSGTSFLTLNHLKAVCPATTPTVSGGVTTINGFTSTQLAAMPTTTFANVFPGGVPSNFIGASGSGGVETSITGTSNSVGYLSPDWTDIALNNSAGNFPHVAKVHNDQNNTDYLPTVSDTTTALGSIAIPTGTDTSDQTKWAPLVPQPTAGYPIVGWTQMFVATCYSTTGVSADLINFLKDHYNISGQGGQLVQDITGNGFVPVPGENTGTTPATGFAAAIDTVFLTGDSNYLNIADTGVGSANATRCNASGVVGR
jgi:phosphate transport system substrate-binding protein